MVMEMMDQRPQPVDVGDPEDPFQRSNFRLLSLRRVIAQQCMDAGWLGITESSLNALVDVLDRYLKKMSRTIAGGREEPLVQDFRLAFREVEPKSTLKELSAFCANVKKSPLDWNLQYPHARKSEIYTSASVPRATLPVSVDDGHSVVHGHTRPDWMDEDLIFPSLDGKLQMPSIKQKVLPSEDQAAAVVNIIIGDDDADIADYLQTHPSRDQPHPATTASPSRLAIPAWPRKLKSILIVDGKVVTTNKAKPYQSRLPVERELFEELKVTIPTPQPEKRKKNCKKASASESPAKKRRARSPHFHLSGAAPVPENLKIRIPKAKGSNRKDSMKCMPVFNSPARSEKTLTDVKQITPPEAREDSTRTAHSPAGDVAPESFAQSIKLTASPDFFVSSKEEAKTKHEKGKTEKVKKTDNDRQKEQEIKRQLERVKERALELGHQVTTLSKPVKRMSFTDMNASEPLQKKHKTDYSGAPSFEHPVIDLESQPHGSLDSDTWALHAADDQELRKKKSDKKHHQNTVKPGRPYADSKSVYGKRDVVPDRTQPIPAITDVRQRVYQRKPGLVETKKLKGQSTVAKNMSRSRPQGKPCLSKRDVPKLIIRFGEKAIAIETDRSSQLDGRSEQISPVHQTCPSASQTRFCDSLVGSSLALSLCKRSGTADRLKSSKSTSKSQGCHSFPVVDIGFPNGFISIPDVPPPSQPPQIVQNVAPPEEGELASDGIVCGYCASQDDIGVNEVNWVCCDDCEVWFHCTCLNMERVPEEEEKWFCSNCICINASKKTKGGGKKAKGASKKTKSR